MQDDLSQPAVIAPSLLAARFNDLSRDLRRLNSSGAEWLHLDIMDGHVYWQHPGSPPPVNTPMINDPLHSTVVQLSRTAIAGKPYTVSEVNYPFPNDWASEGIPILAAYGAFQDWDAIILYTFEPKQDAGNGALATAGLAHQGDGLPLVDAERHIPGGTNGGGVREHPLGRERLAQVAHLQQRSPRRRGRSDRHGAANSGKKYFVRMSNIV